MTLRFSAPERLWLLGIVGLLAAAYLASLRRRQRYVVRFTNLALLDLVAPRQPGWRRHLPAGLLVGALAAMVLGVAQPVRRERVAREEAVVVLALDVSPSMMATDVAPTRFGAMTRAVSRFAGGLPGGVKLGLVSFAGTATVAVPPTTDHALVQDALGRLRFQSQTGLGEAIFAGLEAVALGLPADVGGEALASPPAGIVVLSDGASTAGRPDADAVGQARAARVPVSTILFGTPDGRITLEDREIAVPADGASLRRIAQRTGGRYFKAASGADLTRVYRDIGRAVGTTEEDRELTVWFTAAAFLLALGAGAGSVAWFSRLP